jgi:hypothetical protein
VQDFHFVAPRKLGLIADHCIRKYVAASPFDATTPHGANHVNNVQHNITALGVVMTLFVSKLI